MYTSDKDTIIIDSYEIIEEDLRNNKEARAKERSGRLPQDFRTSLIYLAISAGLAFAGAIYEIFSHGVYSYFMIYAFAITLIGGALPYMLSYIGSLTGRFAQLRALLGSAGDSAVGALDQNRMGMYHAGIATLTVGSIMKGVLDIYGTTNRLTMVYPVIGAILIIAAVALAVRKNTLNINTEQPAA